jgi:hypothetical protein
MYMGRNERTVSVSASHTGKMKDFIHCLTGHKATVVMSFSTILKNVNKKKLNQNMASQIRALLDFVPGTVACFTQQYRSMIAVI